ncbi:capsid protein of prophage [Escherichia coli]|uniref:Capsid protein of prophage n=1 Tax=Escherichia coli TaxID=562 RepID=A0A376CR27_ECOLX|nr:capsid protein of prophage [Escherichia coli]
MDFRRLNRRCCGISPPVLAFPTNSCPVITRRSVIQVPAHPPMSRGAILWGGENLLRPGLATQMFSCWLEEALLRGIIRPPRARFDFYQGAISLVTG